MICSLCGNYFNTTACDHSGFHYKVNKMGNGLELVNYPKTREPILFALEEEIETLKRRVFELEQNVSRGTL